jgi:hypothetical protein
MIARRAHLSFIRVLGIYAAGVLAGIQLALYLFDYYDDGVADLRSAAIAAILLAVGVSFVLWSFRRSQPDLPRNIR